MEATTIVNIFIVIGILLFGYLGFKGLKVSKDFGDFIMAILFLGTMCVGIIVFLAFNHLL